MKNAPVITMEKDEAQKLYGDYADKVKVRKEKYLEELKKVYYHLSKGAKVLDIYEVFKKSGLNEKGDPMLGIARADWNEVTFKKHPLGSGVFNKGEWGSKDMVALPSNTFKDWKIGPASWNPERTEIERQTVKTQVPIVPAHLLPDGALDNYYILFEVDKWNEVPVAKDPYLLKRINANAFVVLAEWDLTDAEIAVMRG